MGVPVITLPGQTFWSRMGLSILSTLGQEGWIAKSKEDYMAIAVDLAGQPQLIAEYRRELRDRMRASPLCDGQRFAAGFEECCRWMIESEQSAVDSLPRV
jgi:protein O-GlcNAc transferase